MLGTETPHGTSRLSRGEETGADGSPPDACQVLQVPGIRLGSIGQMQMSGKEGGHSRWRPLFMQGCGRT